MITIRQSDSQTVRQWVAGRVKMDDFRRGQLTLHTHHPLSRAFFRVLFTFFSQRMKETERGTSHWTPRSSRGIHTRTPSSQARAPPARCPLRACSRVRGQCRAAFHDDDDALCGSSTFPHHQNREKKKRKKPSRHTLRLSFGSRNERSCACVWVEKEELNRRRLCERTFKMSHSPEPTKLTGSR